MSADIELNWEWPAKRAVEDRLLVKIESVKKESGGLFGIKKSPSLAASLPDPFVVNGVVMNTDSHLQGKSLKFVAPKLELEGITSGSYVMLGLINHTTCICVVLLNNRDTDLNSINCPQ